MTSKPPREGARWGDDPAPEPIVVPEPNGPPVEYVKLCKEYGVENTDKAIEIHSKILADYPQVKAVKADPLDFARNVLVSAQKQIEKAAADGRPHTMPETLKKFEQFLGGVLIQHPNTEDFKDIFLNYGDEHLGNAAKQAEKEKEEKAIAWVGGISLVLGLVSFFVTLSDGSTFLESLGIGIFITVGAFFGLAYLYHNA